MAEPRAAGEYGLYPIPNKTEWLVVLNKIDVPDINLPALLERIQEAAGPAAPSRRR